MQTSAAILTAIYPPFIRADLSVDLSADLYADLSADLSAELSDNLWFIYSFIYFFGEGANKRAPNQYLLIWRKKKMMY